MKKILLGGLPTVVTVFKTTEKRYIYSTFLAKPGIWLDDLYLRASYRSKGIGQALIRHLCQIAKQNGCGRIDWTVATSNDRGVNFYERIGAKVRQEVRLCRLDSAAIEMGSRGV
ncbi:MAG: GNAT family N-acetyltransferase [Pseudanabaenales cyanobacterium]|nr:GNAT family N-acetyltransferase [Pseudanabaenales cyanobacterium]